VGFFSTHGLKLQKLKQSIHGQTSPAKPKIKVIILPELIVDYSLNHQLPYNGEEDIKWNPSVCQEKVSFPGKLFFLTCVIKSFLMLFTMTQEKKISVLRNWWWRIFPRRWAHCISVMKS